MKKVTLKEIAEKLNISYTTVSKALKDYPDVSNVTKEKVRALVKKLNYIPNASAINLRTSESKTIGVIIPATVHHFFSTVIKGILEISEKRGYLVILLQSNESSSLEKKQVDLFLNKGVDGLLISLSNETKSFDHIQKIIDYDKPLVLFDKITKSINCSKVIIDDKKAAYKAVKFLINKGYKRIAHFRGNLNPQNSIDRFLGYKQALIDCNIEYDPNLVYICDSNADFDDGYKYANQLIKDHKTNVDAIFAITDVIAIGALKYFNDNNIKVPDDVAIFGFSNWFMSSVVTPSISTIDQPGYKMGKKAAKILLKNIDNKNNKRPLETETIVLKTKLIQRKSC